MLKRQTAQRNSQMARQLRTILKTILTMNFFAPTFLAEAAPGFVRGQEIYSLFFFPLRWQC